METRKFSVLILSCSFRYLSNIDLISNYRDKGLLNRTMCFVLSCIKWKCLALFFLRINGVFLLFEHSRKKERPNEPGTLFAVHYKKIRIHLREMATNRAKIRSTERSRSSDYPLLGLKFCWLGT